MPKGRGFTALADNPVSLNRRLWNRKAIDVYDTQGKAKGYGKITN